MGTGPAGKARSACALKGEVQVRAALAPGLHGLVCAALWCITWAVPAPAQASFAFCPTPAPALAGAWDAHLDMSVLVQENLRSWGVTVAVVSRSGLDLRPIGHRFSHAGFLRSAAHSDDGTPWSVRQLYFDCDAAQARIFDEGLAGFIGGVADGAFPRLSVVWWPEGQGDAAISAQLARTVADDAIALRMLSSRYQANAHAWSAVAQNCNQWLVEMLAAHFGGAADRAGAQAWLREQGYEPSVVRLPWFGWLVVAAVWPHLGLQHHPSDRLQDLQMLVSLPGSIESFIGRRWPQAQRAEWCRRGAEVVLRVGWQPLDEDCTPQEGDRRTTLQP